jgi:hypothetical protein
MHTVVETATFTARAATRLTAEELAVAIDTLAFAPLSGVVVQGTGGIRKVRIAVGGRGKSGGARVIYFYFDVDHPVIALTVFTKNEKADLAPKEKAALAKATAEIKAVWKRR